MQYSEYEVVLSVPSGTLLGSFKQGVGYFSTCLYYLLKHQIGIAKRMAKLTYSFCFHLAHQGYRLSVISWPEGKHLFWKTEQCQLYNQVKCDLKAMKSHEIKFYTWINFWFGLLRIIEKVSFSVGLILWKYILLLFLFKINFMLNYSNSRSK